MGSNLLLRKPVKADIERMFVLLENSLGSFLEVNKSSPKNLQLIIEKDSVRSYLNADIYLCLIAEINSEIVGWMAGSSQDDILLEHGCSPGEFYIEEIVVDHRHRSKGIGTTLLGGIPEEHLTALVVDTLQINKNAIAFYEKRGFAKVSGLPEGFNMSWIRMAKPTGLRCNRRGSQQDAKG